MGNHNCCASRREPEGSLLKPETAEEAYAAGANPAIAGQDRAHPRGGPLTNAFGLHEGDREEMLQELFELCDKNSDSSVTLDEYCRLFKPGENRDEIKKKFASIVGDSSGRITKETFVQYHIGVFGAQLHGLVCVWFHPGIC